MIDMAKFMAGFFEDLFEFHCKIAKKKTYTCV